MGYQWDDEQEEEGETHQAPHAWAEVLIPGAGWRGFDPTTGLVANDGYIVVAVGRDYLDAAPQREHLQRRGGGHAPRSDASPPTGSTVKERAPSRSDERVARGTTS